MNATTIVNAVASVALAHLAVVNTQSLTAAVLAYFVGGVIVHYVLANVMGPTTMNTTVDYITVAAVSYVFYNKYKLTGVVASILAPTVISLVLVYLGVRF